MTKIRGNHEVANHKTRLNYMLGLDECINPEKCVCILCKRKREEKDNDKGRQKRTK